MYLDKNLRAHCTCLFLKSKLNFSPSIESILNAFYMKRINPIFLKKILAFVVNLNEKGVSLSNLTQLT